MEFKTELYAHQKNAVAKMMRSRIGTLFMEMGTGKTRVALELISMRQHRISNVIWYCPVSLKQTIYNEIKKHTDLSLVYVFNNKTNQHNIPGSLIHIVGLESMSNSSRVVFAAAKVTNNKSFIIIDESDLIKGYKSRRTKWITQISNDSLYRLIMTGTPISQGIVDLYTQMYFLSPKILGYNSFYSFAHNHLEYSDKYKGMIVRSHNEGVIAAKIQPYVYQITKKECLDLPGKIYETYCFDMTYEQRDAYNEAKYSILMDIDYDDFDSVTIFRLFTALQQITSGFWNCYNGVDYEKYCYKNNRPSLLLDIISKIPDDEKIIIWCKFEHDIDVISKSLESIYGSESFSLFFGKISEKFRNIQIEAFRKSKRFFVSTLSCGGRGLTLNEASYVIYYNTSFKYSERLQTEDRCHRIGQTEKVMYIDIVCENSIDERIQSAITTKGNVVDSFKREVNKIKDKGKLKKILESL